MKISKLNFIKKEHNSSLREWIKKIQILLETKYKRNKFYLADGGKVVNIDEIREELIKRLEEQRRLEIEITFNEIITKSNKLFLEHKNKFYSAYVIF